MNLGIVIGIGIVTIAAGFLARWLQFTNVKKGAEAQASHILVNVKQEITELEKTASENQHQFKQRQHEQETETKGRMEVIGKRVRLLEKQGQKWDERLNQLNKLQDKVKERSKGHVAEAKSLHEQQISDLVKKSNKDEETVLLEIEERYVTEFQRDYEKFLQKSEHFMKEEAPKVACSILKSIMNRYREPSSVSRLENTISVPDDRAIGRIIGKEGININYFESKANVAVVFNDHAPSMITVSCFHLLRREIARIALKRLIRQKVISEEVIDQALEQARKEMDKQLEKIGTWAADVIDLPTDKRDPKLLRLMGRLKYRTSYGQNILYHSLEIAFFSAMMAAEIGADINISKMGGFFHDLGKAIDQDDDVDKAHDLLSKELLEEFGFSWEITHAAWTHHDAIPIETVEAEIVKAADAISAGRPGARAESTEDYYARLAALEGLAKSEPGVEKVFAMSAGRELRCFMNPDVVKDEDLAGIAHHLKTEIENNVAYPGKIKVNLIRKLTAVDYAGGRS